MPPTSSTTVAKADLKPLLLSDSSQMIRSSTENEVTIRRNSMHQKEPCFPVDIEVASSEVNKNQADTSVTSEMVDCLSKEPASNNLVAAHPNRTEQIGNKDASLPHSDKSSNHYRKNNKNISSCVY